MPNQPTTYRALKIIEKEKKEKTGVLDLVNCGLKYIPDEVCEMTWLTVLGVSGISRWSTEQAEWQERYISITNNLVEIPEWISNLQELKQLSLSGSELKSLNHLSNLTALQFLKIDGVQTQIIDISPLSKLKNLTALALSSKVKIDLSPLSSLPGLIKLSLDCKSSFNINTLNSIKSLSIQNLEKSQFEKVGQLRQLQDLNLSGKQIDSIETIQSLTNLRTLNLNNTKVNDISSLANIQSLKSLHCYGSNVEDLRPLSNLMNLAYLDISSTKVVDLSPLSTLPMLQTLYCSNTQIRDLSPLSDLKKLQSLSCDSTQISDLRPISNLTKLKTLSLSNTKISKLNPTASLLNLQKLYCDSTQVTHLGPISDLINLEVLYCSETKIRDLKPISNLLNLREFYCHKTQIIDLSPISNLVNLQTLLCSETKISDLSPISHLSNLQELYCNNNQINDLCPLSDLPSLKTLHCFETSVKDLSPIGNLPKLENLYCHETQIDDLSPISKLQSLKYLACDHTQVSDLSPVSKLSNLKSLSFNSTQVSDLNPVSNMAKLQMLYFGKTKIRDLNPISDLPNLQELYCNENKLSELSPISRLPNLKTLFCSHTQVSDLSSLTSIPSLEYIDCNYTKVDDLKPLSDRSDLSMLSCENTQVTDLTPINSFLRSEFSHFECSGCPLIVPPVEFANSSKQAIVEYYDELEQGHNPLNEVKVIFLGEGASGKTSLIKRLRNEAFDEEESQTHGIRIRQTPYKIKNETIMANLWDFGGQEVMHATHQFFLSQRCIYVLVLNSRTDDKAEYWLKHANSFGGNSPVLVALNKVDENPSFQVNSKVLSEKYPQIKGYHRLSCKTDEGVEELKRALVQQIGLSDACQTPFPDTWRGVKDSFVALDEDYIESSIFKEICNINGVEKSFSQSVLLQFLHDLGIVINFQRLKNFDTQILNPLWLTSGVYRVINSSLIAAQSGLFEEIDFDDIINDPRYTIGNTNEKVYHYPVNKLHYIVRVMQEFELCFQLDNCRYIIPQLLPVEEPEVDMEGATINFVINFPEFLPDSIFPRLMVKLHGLITDDLRWRSGMVLRAPLLFGNTSARVRSDKEDKRISIDACGEEPRRLLSYIRETLKEIIRAFADLQYEEELRIPETDVFLSYDELVNLEAMKVDEYPVGKLKKTVSVSGLLNGVEEASMRDDDAKAEVKAFLSYAHLDLKEKDKLRAALSPLERLNKLSIWDDHAIDAGEEWEKEIFDQLDKAEIVLCLVSPDFINSDFCHQRELTQALDAHGRGDKMVVPLQLRECDWDDLPISRLQGIPGDWILSSKNQDKARAKVSKKLRKAIEQVKAKRKNHIHGF